VRRLGCTVVLTATTHRHTVLAQIMRDKPLAEKGRIGPVDFVGVSGKNMNEPEREVDCQFFGFARVVFVVVLPWNRYVFHNPIDNQLLFQGGGFASRVVSSSV